MQITLTEQEIPQHLRQFFDPVEVGNVPAKNLLMIPAMFAFAARADGWYLRSEIIWAKPNPMPESVTDRPTKAHEQVFLLAKSSRYYWDADAVREDCSPTSHGSPNIVPGQKNETLGQGDGNLGKWTAEQKAAGRNIRTVWTIATRPYAKAHYAVWPETLVEPMILASTSARGCCPQCGAGWRRVVNVERKAHESMRVRDGEKARPGPIQTTPGVAHTPENFGVERTTTGWEPSCECDAGEPVPCTVLDPFAGSGTTGRVAVRHRRAAILCDISGEYLEDHVPDRTTVQMRLGVVA